MKRKIFASILSALMVTSSVSGVLMADSNEETTITEGNEVVVEETIEDEEEVYVEEETSEDIQEIETEEVAKEDETISEDLVEEDSLDTLSEDEAVEEDNVFDEIVDVDELPVPVLEDYEIPGTDTHVERYEIHVGMEAIGYLMDTDGNSTYDYLVIEGKGDLYGYTKPHPLFKDLRVVMINEGITSIGEYFFSECQDLEVVNIPNTVTAIRDNAFDGCTHLTGIHIPNGVKTMGDNVFQSCSYLETVEMEDSVETIGSSMFNNCNSLKTLRLSNKIKKLPEGIFSHLKISSINIPSGVEEIPGYCFYSCPNLTSVTIPAKVKKIGDYAFCNCEKLKTVTINSKLEEIGKGAFVRCGFATIKLPNTLSVIGGSAFYESKLKEIEIPAGVKYIEAETFWACKDLSHVTINEGTLEIKSKAFGNCESLKKIHIPNSMKTVNIYMFSGSNVEVTVSCKFQSFKKVNGVSKLIFIHEYDHASDTTCNRCGAVREIHLVTMDQFVERLYTTCLGRKSEAAGKEYWIKKLVNGTTGAEAAHQFFFSSEFTSKKLANPEFISRLYKTFLGRDADATGMDFWLNRFKEGYTREQVFQGFVNSQEWADLCLQYGIKSGGTKTSTAEKEPSKGCFDFATRLYTTCLGRNPDSAGLKDWVTKLATLKTTGTKAAHGFFFSKEFTSKNYSNEEYIKRLYRTFMGREADANGIKYWQDKFKSGYTREQVFQGFANSAEFEKICIQYGILK